MRLIDADAFLERMSRTDRFFGVVYDINDAPTVDAVEVVHGRWLTWEEQFPGRKPRKKSRLGVFCSTCHNHADNMSDYCPNCGAKMDADTQEREENMK